MVRGRPGQILPINGGGHMTAPMPRVRESGAVMADTEADDLEAIHHLVAFLLAHRHLICLTDDDRPPCCGGRIREDDLW